MGKRRGGGREEAIQGEEDDNMSYSYHVFQCMEKDAGVLFTHAAMAG